MTATTSAGICWPPCTHQSSDHDQHILVTFGRCRSGRRWYWCAFHWPDFDSLEAERGWVDTEPAAIDAARAAVVRIAAGRPAVALYAAGYATADLKRINVAKRAARAAPDTTDTLPVEYLYAIDHCRGSLDCDNAYEPMTPEQHWQHHIRSFRITKRTAKRIYYVRREPGDIGYVDRQGLEEKGEVWRAGGWWEADKHLYATPPPAPEHIAAPDLKQLKAEMAAAHPDRGGSNEQFREARRRYVTARDRAVS